MYNVLQKEITKKHLSGEMTIEAAIIVPIVMMMIASLMYLCLYIHDGVSIKSYVYAIGNKVIDKENGEFEKNVREEMTRIPLFLMRVNNIQCSSNRSNYIIKINMSIEGKIKWMDKILQINDNEYIIEIEKDLQSEILYAGRAACDGLKNKKE